MQVAVTGATGFIGSEVVKVLLDRGYIVHGTVRNPDDTAKVAPLLELVGASDRLRLFKADLLDRSGFDAAFEGCDVVMHVASPYVVNVDHPQRDLVEPALIGTTNILEAANAAGVTRMVLTSSAAAITDEPENRVYTEADWNEKSSLTRNPYYYSKTLAERAAWAFVAEETPSFDLIDQPHWRRRTIDRIRSEHNKQGPRRPAQRRCVSGNRRHDLFLCRCQGCCRGPRSSRRAPRRIGSIHLLE